LFCIKKVITFAKVFNQNRFIMRRFAIFVVLSVLFFGSYNPNLKAVDNTEGGVQTFAVNSELKIDDPDPADKTLNVMEGEYFTFSFTIRTDSPASVTITSPNMEEVMARSNVEDGTRLEFSAYAIGTGTIVFTVIASANNRGVREEFTVNVTAP